MTKPTNGYSTEEMSTSAPIGTCVLSGVHLGAALLLLWPATAQWASFLQMRADSVFYRAQVWRPVTGTFFFSSDLWETVWLVLFLAVFGFQLERQLATRRYLMFYLLAGAGSCLLWAGSAIAWADKLDLGTSAAITGVMTLALSRNLRSRFLVWNLLPVPAWSLVVLYFGVAYRFYAWDSWTLLLPAHLGGALVGLLYHQFDCRSVHEDSDTDAEAKIASCLSDQEIDFSDLGAVEMNEPDPFEEVEEEDEDECLEEQVDQILKKISDDGPASLTESERELLERASKEYRQRRV